MPWSASSTESVCIVEWSYQLLSQRNLLDLHLVNTGLGRAQKRGGGKKSALHDGQSVEDATKSTVEVLRRWSYRTRRRSDGGFDGKLDGDEWEWEWEWGCKMQMER